MIFRSLNKQTAFAPWSLWIAILSAQLLIVSLVLQRMTSFPTGTALNLIAASYAGASIAIGCALATFVAIWTRGQTGLVRAGSALAICAGMLAWPGYYFPTYLKLPSINDVTTDLNEPPAFVKRTGGAGANPPRYGGAQVASLQAVAYPDIKPILTDLSVGQAYQLTQEVVGRLKWDVVHQQAPKRTGSASARAGLIEAVDRSLILGFPDDVVLKLRPEGEKTRIDVRSKSRYGQHDLGRNAERTREVLKRLEARLEAAALQAPAAVEEEAAPVAKAPKSRKKRRRRARASSGNRGQRSCRTAS